MSICNRGRLGFFEFNFCGQESTARAPELLLAAAVPLPLSKGCAPNQAMKLHMKLRNGMLPPPLRMAGVPSEGRGSRALTVTQTCTGLGAVRDAGGCWRTHGMAPCWADPTWRQGARPADATLQARTRLFRCADLTGMPTASAAATKFPNQLQLEDRRAACCDDRWADRRQRSSRHCAQPRACRHSHSSPFSAALPPASLLRGRQV